MSFVRIPVYLCVYLIYLMCHMIMNKTFSVINVVGINMFLVTIIIIIIVIITLFCIVVAIIITISAAAVAILSPPLPFPPIIIIIITNFASMCFLLLFKYKYPTFNFLVRCVSVIIILISSSSNNYRRNKEFQSLIHNYISSKPSQIRYTSHNLFQGQAILLNLYTIFTSHRYSSMIVICKETTMGTLFKGNNDM